MNHHDDLCANCKTLVCYLTGSITLCPSCREKRKNNHIAAQRQKENANTYKKETRKEFIRIPFW